MLHDLGMIEALNIKVLKKRTVVLIEQLLNDITNEPENGEELINEVKKQVLEGLENQIQSIKSKPEQLLKAANFRDREMILKVEELVSRLDVNSVIEDLEDDLDTRKEKIDREEIGEYAVFWKRNQKLFSNLYSAWTVTMGLNIELIFLKENVATDIRISIFGMFKRLSLHLEELFIDTIGGIEKQARKFDDQELLAHNPTDFLAKIQEELRDNIRHLPETLELIKEDSILNFEDSQEGEVEQRTIDLQKIADYYIDLDFIEPLSRRIEHTYHQITSRFEDMGNRISFINDIADSTQDGKQKQIKDLKAKMLLDLKDLNQVIDRTEIEFVEMLEKQFSELTQKLSISELQNTSTGLNRFVHIKNSYQGLFEKVSALKNKTVNWVASSVFELKRKQHQLKIAEFNDRHKTLVNKRKMFRSFVDKNSINTDVYAKLPTYYRHLFTGSQVFNKQLVISRELELNQAVSALAIGDTGAVLVISEPQGGKLHFIETLIQKTQPPKVFRISPPKQGIDENTNLLDVFRKTTGIDGNFFKIMDSLPEGTTFVFGKLELWWLRKNNGDKHIDKLVWLIERYGSKHNFILTINNFAYDLIRQVTNLDAILSATIILPPVNSNELAQLMYERHKLAGVKILFANKPDKEPSKRELIKHFEKYCNAAKGNVGATFLSWLGSIEKYEEDTVTVRPYVSNQLPASLPVAWSVLLTHLVLHDRLHLSNILTIFYLQDKASVIGVIKELKYTKLINEVSKNTFAIEASVSKLIIERLKKQNYLKRFE